MFRKRAEYGTLFCRPNKKNMDHNGEELKQERIVLVQRRMTLTI